jgi:hypothetical protein
MVRKSGKMAIHRVHVSMGSSSQPPPSWGGGGRVGVQTHLLWGSSSYPPPQLRASCGRPERPGRWVRGVWKTGCWVSATAINWTFITVWETIANKNSVLNLYLQIRSSCSGSIFRNWPIFRCNTVEIKIYLKFFFFIFAFFIHKETGQILYIKKQCLKIRTLIDSLYMFFL